MMESWGIGSLLFSSPSRVWYTPRWLSAEACMKMVWLGFLRERKWAFAKCSSCLNPLPLSAFNCLLNFLTALTARQASRIALLLTS